MSSNDLVPLYNPALGSVAYFPNYPETIALWNSRGWVLPPPGTLPSAAPSTVLTLTAADLRYAPIGSGSGGGGTSPTGLALDTDGIPYFSATGTTALAADTDGVPYFTA